jgi:hypothetical protein
MNRETKIKMLSGLMWLLAAWELLNALGSTIFLNWGAALYGWQEYASNAQSAIVFHQYGMVLYVLAVAYAIIATDPLKCSTHSKLSVGRTLRWCIRRKRLSSRSCGSCVHRHRLISKGKRHLRQTNTSAKCS